LSTIASESCCNFLISFRIASANSSMVYSM